MNRRFTAISLGLNLVLLGVFLFRLHPSRLPAQPELNGKKRLARAATVIQVTNVIDATGLAAAPPNFHWRDIESEDYPSYIANLRAVHCPEKTIFDIIFADIEKLFAARTKNLQAPEKFWVAGDDLEKVRVANLDKLSELQEEKRALIKALLNSELDWEVMQDWYKENELGLFAAFLPDAQAERALSVAKKFVDHIENLERRSGGLSIPEDALEKNEVYSEMMAALGGIVSSGDLEEGELRLVCLISYLFANSDLKESKLNGPELRQITRLKLRLDNPLLRELAKYDGGDSAPEELAKQNFLEQVKFLLGDVRFQQYLSAHDNEFDQLCKLTEKNGLRAPTALSIYEIQSAASLASLQVRENRTLRRKERLLELENIQQSTREAVQQMLGEKAMAVYSTNGGSWIADLVKK